MDSESKLEQFVLLARSARGPALAKLIEKVTAEPGVFSFGELLDVPSVKEVRLEYTHACFAWTVPFAA
jgi:COP9 signalosome complex subunit 7